MELRTVVAIVSAALLCGCSYLQLDQREPAFKNTPVEAAPLLVLIGGNSECKADGGVWLSRDDIAKDIARGLGEPDVSRIAKRYFSWTGDVPGGTCLPSRWGYISNGKRYILESLDSEGLLDGRKIVVVGWSNGAATANQFSALLHEKKGRTDSVNLLVTMDPVSTFTHREDPHAKVWQNVYVRSEDLWQKISNSSNWIAFGGGAWNNFGPASQPCVAANHGDVWLMWNEVIRQERFVNWTVGKERMAPHNKPMDPGEKRMYGAPCPIP